MMVHYDDSESTSLQHVEKRAMMRKLTLQDLNEAAKIGGSNALTEVTSLAPAAGMDGIIAPSKYNTGKSAGNAPTYVYEKRCVNGECKTTVLIDSRTSQANRLEDYIIRAIEIGHPIFSKMPRIRVRYEMIPGDESSVRYFDDVQLPHRAVDAHIRIAEFSESDKSAYVAARNSNMKDLSAMLDISPVTVMFGCWDSTRNKNQLRIPASFNGEIYAVLADQTEESPVHRAGARVDPVAAGVHFTKKAANEVAVHLKGSMREEKLKEFMKDGKGATIVIGALPPSTEEKNLDGIAVRSITRTHILSFSMLRAMHFGRGVEGDEAIRVLLAAALINAMVGSNAELHLRANCFLVEADEPKTVLDRRGGKHDDLEMLTLEDADELLAQAYAQAQEKAGIDWHGQIITVQGDPAVIESASAADDDDK
nr:type I-U CRISPR-associated RAMP protein Csb1/Cas7u [Bifidobacterium pseudolongum]